MKHFEEEVVDFDEILNIVNEMKILSKEDKYKSDSIKGLKKDYPDGIERLEEALLIFVGENDLKILKTKDLKFLDKWKNLTEKWAYPYEDFNSLDDYQNFFTKLKNKWPDDEEIERTKEGLKYFNIKNGENLTQLIWKSDVLLLTCVFGKFLKAPVNKFGINALYCVSLPGFTWKCWLKYAAVNLQTLQDKYSILTLKNKIRGGISSIMGDCYVKSDEIKNIAYGC